MLSLFSLASGIHVFRDHDTKMTPAFTDVGGFIHLTRELINN